jgi:hypothetical protein
MKALLFLLIGVILFLNSASLLASPKGIPIEVWSGGDDGLTQRFRDALERRFESSDEFVLSTGKKPGTLVATIPTHVQWVKQGSRTQLQYEVQFTSIDESRLGDSEGQCWEDEIANCTARAYRDAKRAARKLH